jgi:hypothetical protein
MQVYQQQYQQQLFSQPPPPQPPSQQQTPLQQQQRQHQQPPPLQQQHQQPPLPPPQQQQRRQQATPTPDQLHASFLSPPPSHTPTSVPHTPLTALLANGSTLFDAHDIQRLRDSAVKAATEGGQSLALCDLQLLQGLDSLLPGVRPARAVQAAGAGAVGAMHPAHKRPGGGGGSRNTLHGAQGCDMIGAWRQGRPRAGRPPQPPPSRAAPGLTLALHG